VSHDAAALFAFGPFAVTALWNYIFRGQAGGGQFGTRPSPGTPHRPPFSRYPVRRSLHAFLVGLLTLSFSVDTAKACWYLRQGRAACVVRPACPPPVLRHAPGPVRVIVIQPAGCGGPGEFGGAMDGFAYEEIPCGPPVACCGDADMPVADAIGQSAVIAVPTPAPGAARPDVVRETPRSLPAIAQQEPLLTLPLTVAPTPVPAPVPDLQPVSPAANVQPVTPEQPPVDVMPVEVKPVTPAEGPAPLTEKKPEPPAIDPFADPAPAEKPVPTEPASEKAPLPAKDPVPPADPVAEEEPAPAPQPPLPEEKPPVPAPEPPAEPAEENLFDTPSAAKPTQSQADAPKGEPATDAQPEPQPPIEPPADEKPAAQPSAEEPAEEPAEESKATADEEPAAETNGEQAGETEKATPATKEEPARAEPAFDPFSAVEPLRRWIDDTGRHAAVGRFVAAGVDGVELLTPDSRTLVVPFQRLSAIDRSYATEAAARQVAAKRPLPAPETTAGR
jgi:hypothetical protein